MKTGVREDAELLHVVGLVALGIELRGLVELVEGQGPKFLRSHRSWACLLSVLAAISSGGAGGAVGTGAGPCGGGSRCR
jgi:hypothetical protein